jgi:hypothetical protein
VSLRCNRQLSQPRHPYVQDAAMGSALLRLSGPVARTADPPLQGEVDCKQSTRLRDPGALIAR